MDTSDIRSSENQINCGEHRQFEQKIDRKIKKFSSHLLIYYKMSIIASIIFYYFLVYGPLSVRLVQQLEAPGWRNLRDVLDTLPGNNSISRDDSISADLRPHLRGHATGGGGRCGEAGGGGEEGGAGLLCGRGHHGGGGRAPVALPGE